MITFTDPGKVTKSKITDTPDYLFVTGQGLAEPLPMLIKYDGSWRRVFVLPEITGLNHFILMDHPVVLDEDTEHAVYFGGVVQ